MRSQPSWPVGAAVYREPGAAGQHCAELLSALQARPEIRRMARNPVMLTALAVVHWNERRLPEQRADLYESIITWLSRSREQRRDAPPPTARWNCCRNWRWKCRNDPAGRQTQMPKRGRRRNSPPSSPRAGQESHRPAPNFLDEEEVDSGIIVRRGNEVAFWH